MVEKGRKRKGRRGPLKGQGGRPRKGAEMETEHFALRVPVKLMERIKARHEAAQTQQPMISIAQTVRDLLTKALDAEEASTRPHGAKRSD